MTRSTFGPLQKKAMRVRFSGQHTKIGETPSALAQARLEGTVKKYFDGDAEAKVVFGHVGLIYRAGGTRRPDRVGSQPRCNRRNLSIHHAKARAHARASA